MKTRDGNNSGEITIEATIVMFISICVVLFVINICFFIYHMQVAPSVARRTASDVAAVYSRTYKEPFFGYMQRDYFMDTSPYRYWGSGLETKNKDKARWYACYLVSRYSMGSVTDPSYPDVQATVSENALGQREIKVDVKLTYPVFLLNPLTGLGANPEYTVDGTATAICIDPLHDMNCTKVHNEIYNKVVGFSTTTKIINNISTFIANIVTLINKIKG